jgi:catechol 2,3-dioxygenase-like lactoylglutathione lyase family enzyme
MPAFTRTVPMLRIFSVDKAREFYLGFLGFTVDWEHRFEPEAPLYMQVSRDGLVLHLTEHHGDGCPGAAVFVETAGLTEFQRELVDRRYPYYRPGIEDAPWGARIMRVVDPFGNRITFNEMRTAENAGHE